MIEEIGSANTPAFSCGVERNVDFVLHQKYIHIYKSVNHDYNIDNVVPLLIALPDCKCPLSCIYVITPGLVSSRLAFVFVSTPVTCLFAY